METAIYFIGVIDGLKTAIIYVSVLLVCISICVICVNYYMNCGEGKETKTYISIKKMWWKFLFIGLAATILSQLIPCSKTLAAMIMLPSIIDSNAFKKAKDTPEKAIDLLNLKLDEYIKDAKKKSE